MKKKYTKKHKRLIWFGLSLLLAVSAVVIIVTALRENIVFFKTPSQLRTEHLAIGSRLRLGGLVQKDSFIRKNEHEVMFVLTDFIFSLNILYKGVLPDLFREGQCLVIEGVLVGEDVFNADFVFAKHDENYIPKNIGDSLKKQGNWQLYANCLGGGDKQ